LDAFPPQTRGGARLAVSRAGTPCQIANLCYSESREHPQSPCQVDSWIISPRTYSESIVKTFPHVRGSRFACTFAAVILSDVRGERTCRRSQVTGRRTGSPDSVIAPGCPCPSSSAAS
jgi:hypothetical protein